MSASAPNSATPSHRPARRRRRWPWIFLGGLLAGSALVIGLLLTPPIQGWLLRRLVASQPGWRVDFEKFGAGPTGFELHGLDFAMPGLNASSAPIALRIAPGRLLNRRELRIERVEARKLLVTLTPAELPTSPEPFAGVLQLLQSPLAWALDEAQLDGEIAVREGGQSIVIGSFVINGGGASPEAAGEFSYELTLNSTLLPPGPDNKVRSRGRARLTQGADHGLRQIVVEGDLTLPRYGPLALPTGKFSLHLTATPAGEDYRAQLELGSAGRFEFAGHLDAPRAKLTGRATAHADQSLVASLAGEKLPTAALDGTADVTLDLREGDLDLALAGNLDARDWARLAPELAVVDAFQGRLTAALSRRAGKLSLTRADATLIGEKSSATLRVALSAPVDPTALPRSPVATVRLERLPLAWANPWLAASGLVLDPADLSAAWNLILPADRSSVQLSPIQPLEIAALGLKGTKLPALPPLRLAFNPHLTFSTTEAVLTIDDFVATTTPGDRLTAKLAARYDLLNAIAHTSGELSGAAPTLLSGADRPLPFTLDARWDATLAGTELRLKTFALTAQASAGTPCFALQLLQPLTLDLDQLTTPATTSTAEWARLTFARFPLDWVSRWLPPYQLAGTLAAGESVLRSSVDGQLTFETTTPWRLVETSVGVGGKTFFAGEASVAPDIAIHADRYTAELRNLEASHRDGSRIHGSISAEARAQDRKASTTIALDAELPALPHSATTFGPLFATLRARSHNETDTIVVVDAFELRVRNRDRELLALNAPAPFLVGMSGSGMLTAGTVAPLTLTTDELPLAWLKPWLDGIEAEGTLQPAEFALTAQLTKFLLRPVKPVHVRDFSARVAGRDIAHEMAFTASPGLDLTLICMPFPTFQLGYSGIAHLTHGTVDVGGKRAVDVDAALSFIGNDQTILPNAIDYTTRADFAELSRVPALAGSGLPTRGTLVARAHGDMLGQAPIEAWMRLEGLPASDNSRVLPALEITASGKVSRQQTVAGSVEVRLETLPRITDAKFDAALNLTAGKLEIASGFHSQFFDAAEALAFWEGLYSPPAPPEKNSPPTASRSGAMTAKLETPARKPTYAQLGVPFWSHLRGHFDLDLGRVRFAPYQIDRLRGRLDLREHELVLGNLSGEMFAGRWSGQLRVDYHPENKTADHAASGEFRIEQFDSARVVQTVFPTELASVDAKIDVRSTVRSRGNALFELIDRAEGDFTIDGRQGIVRLTAPKQDFAATAAVFGGTVLLSPELRALGRLLKKFAEMPVDQLRVSGARNESGDVQLREFRIDSPQARLLAHGKISAREGEPLMNRPLELSIELAAKEEMAVILGGMSLLEKKPRADGYRSLKEPFELRGKAGAPDTRPLYDLFARAVLGSKGTWGFLMRKAQEKMNKTKPPAAQKPTVTLP